jgi:microcystin-dependent protein
MPIAPLPWLARELPQGTIQIWSGSIASIPSGWGICDGLGGRPDLLDKFVKGVATAVTEPGAVGGLASVTITSSQIASHNHTSSPYVHTHTVAGGTGDSNGGARYTNTGDQDDSQNTVSRVPPGQNLIATGSNGAHENLPPFYVLAYIIKL